MWEHIITLGQEKQLFWQKKWSGSSALFFVVRYSSLGVRILEFSTDFQHTSNQASPIDNALTAPVADYLS